MCCNRILLSCFFAFILRGGILLAQQIPPITNLHFHLDYPIHHILPDPKGFLWLATEKGLVRYDGSTTEVYAHDPQNPQSLPMNRIWALALDAQTGYIWIATGNAGLVRFDPKAAKNKAFKTFKSVLNDPKTVGSNALNALIIDDKHRMWIVGDGAYLTEMNLDTYEFTRHTEGVAPRNFSLTLGNRGQLWMGSMGRGLTLFDTEQKKVVNSWTHEGMLPPDTEKHIYSHNAVVDMKFDAQKQGVWYTSTALGLMYLDLKTNKTHIFSNEFPPFNGESEGNISSLSFYKNGQIWIGHNSQGIKILDSISRQIVKQPLSESGTAQSKKAINVQSLYYDIATHTMWIGTRKGLFSYNESKNTYTKLSSLPTHSDKIVDISENLFDVKRSLWILTEKDVIKIDAKTHQEVMRLPLPPSVVINRWSVLMVQPSGVYIQSNMRLSQIDEIHKKVVVMPMYYDINGVADDTLPNGEPVRWFSTNDVGLIRLRQNGKIENFQHFPTKVFISVYRTKDGTVWITTDNWGLLRIKDKMSLSFDHFMNKPDDKYSLADNIPLHFYTDSQNKLWVTTATNGIVQIENPNAEKPIFHRYSINRTQEPFVSYIYEDADGLFWLNILDAKPYVFNPKTGESVALKGDGSDILPDRLSDKIKIGEGQKGIWLSNTEGVVFIDKTKDLIFPKRSLPIFFTNLTIFDRDETPRLCADKLQLSYKENFFALSFSALNFEGNTLYRYKLEGIDPDWVYVGQRNVAYYTDLSPGIYTFRVRASVGIYTGDDRETILEIVITPPYWKTLWFRLLVLITVLGSAFWLHQNRLRRTKLLADLKQKEAETAQLRAEFQQKIAETELAALRAQMNPHFIFNCLNSLNLYILENKAELASDYLQRFSRLIRLVLENSRFERIPLSNELEALNLYMQMEVMRFKEKLTFYINVDAKIDTETTTIPPLLIQPFVENSVWHGLMHKLEGGTIWINLNQITEGVLCVEVIDNGIGRAAAAQIKSKSAMRQKSFGMKVTSERIAAINQIYSIATKVDVIDLFDESGKATGTKVVIEIPLSN
ncbi:MAG: histidine kinase [Saprospiraceae bacterium]|nr:histidine kinase [Saprospiraceae bacterium]